MARIASVLLLPVVLALGACGDRGDERNTWSGVSAETPNSFLQIPGTPDSVNTQAWVNAYYNAVDPGSHRDTLAKWKQQTCFGTGAPVTHVIFRDAKDLGYGRDMYACKDGAGNFAVYVQNFVVQLDLGGNANYGPLNVEAAIEQDPHYLFGTNAIEFSADPHDSSTKIAKFFTFAPGTDGQQHRITAGDLDGRGTKYIPNACMACHGGKLLPLEHDGSFPVQTLRSAKLNLIDPAILEYSTKAGYDRASLEAGIKAINTLVYQSYQETNARPASQQGHWSGDFAAEITEGRYGLYSGSSFPNAAQDDAAIPSGWTANVSRPAGVETLYKQVIEPHCISCHSLQGTAAAESSGGVVNGINFSSYERFISYKDRIADYVYRRGIMPLSLRNFESFWKHPEGAPTLLASYLNDVTLFDPNGNVLQPGRAYAKPGTPRTVKSSPVQLDGSNSDFATSYKWTIAGKPAGATASLNSNTSAKPVLTANMDGQYVLMLVVSNAKGPSAPRTTTITIDSAANDPTDLTFDTDIRGILNGGSSSTDCTSCHSPAGVTGIPVYWSDDGKNTYQQVLGRINLKDPENSRILRKPTDGQHHGGGNAMSDEDYNTVLNWIMAGAPCGSNTTFCD